MSDTPTTTAATTPLRFGFRRRCGWCGVVLRGWQLNLCRLCKRAVRSDHPMILSSPPCPSRSRWDDQPDLRRRRAR